MIKNGSNSSNKNDYTKNDSNIDNSINDKNVKGILHTSQKKTVKI